MKKRISKRQPLSNAAIAEAALDIADAEGLEKLSFRTLAQKLHCEAMSLYHYFPSKAHLLDAVASICLKEIEFLDKQSAWQQRMRGLAWDYRKMALRHPGFFPFLAVYRMNSLEGLGVLDQALSVFEATGLDVETRARQFRIFGYFLTGSCLDETIGYAKGPSAAEPVPPELAAQKFPAIMVVGPFFSPSHHARTFEIGLEALIAEVERLVAISAK